ncbi:MAG: nucleotidyltransferase family protein [Lachnospiraceae bacterium]|nr:nucleotidyltransferase family protein [Lachnospiraceae bacterium]
MKTAAVIAEFNPFHNGHQYLLQKAKEEGADRVVVIMSCDYLQRGEPACMGRYARAEAALRSGAADVVLAYPSRYASASAETFAFQAVRMLDSLHCIDELIFGSECGNTAPLLRCAEILVQEPPFYREALRNGLKEGMSFPKARAQALPEYADLLSSPNNILGIEYLKALLRLHSSIKPKAILREGAGYLDQDSSLQMPSALAIREKLRRNPGNTGISSGTAEEGDSADQKKKKNILLPSNGIPSESLPVLQKEIETYGIMTAEAYASILVERLWSCGNALELAAYEDVTEDLAGTFIRKRNDFQGFESFAKSCASKNLPLAHVRRALLHIALGFRKGDFGTDAGFVQVLGFRKEAADCLAAIRLNADIPVLVNPPAERDGLQGEARRLFEEELRISNLYEALRSMQAGIPARNELSRPVVKV